VGMSPHHLQRTFKRLTGLSPKQYVAARRMERFKTRLRQGDSVTDAVYEAGYGSGSRLYERADAHLGMTPAVYQRGRRGLQIRYGSTRTYGQIASGLGAPRAARAVARACAQNRAALVIPCHRVVRNDGQLGGYRWGVQRKRRLLDLEKGSG